MTTEQARPDPVSADSETGPPDALRAPDALDLDGLERHDLTEWLETMMLIREFETACDPLALAGKVIGGIHSSAGQEAVAVGAMRALLPQDKVAGSHRSHHHALARGLPPAGVMAELYGRATGVSEGRGGSMHLRDWQIGYAGGNGIVGAGVGLAMGLALAAKLQHQDHVAVGFFGDGGIEHRSNLGVREPRRRLASPADHRLREQPLCRRDTEHTAHWWLLDRGAGHRLRHPRLRR